MEAQTVSVSVIARHLINANPETALEALIRKPGLFDMESSALHDTLYDLARKTPQLIIANFDALSGEARRVASIAITESWLSDPDSASGYLVWASALSPGPALDSSATLISRHYRDTDPPQALDWAQSVGEPTERQSLMKEILNYANSEQLPAIAERLQHLQIPAEEREALEADLEKRLTEDYSTLILPE